MIVAEKFVEEAEGALVSFRDIGVRLQGAILQ